MQNNNKIYIASSRDNPNMKQLFDTTKRMQSSSWSPMSMRAPSKVNYSWCKINFRISNKVLLYCLIII